MTIVVCPLSRVPEQTRVLRPSHLITLLDPDHPLETPEGVAPERHLKLGVHDICDPCEGQVRPDEALVERIVAFGRTWDATAPILIHCWAGISRSTATAFTLACEKNPHVEEREIALAMRQASRFAFPNRRIVALADDLLGRRGRMVDAVNAMGSADIRGESEPFAIRAVW